MSENEIKIEDGMVNVSAIVVDDVIQKMSVMPSPTGCWVLGVPGDGKMNGVLLTWKEAWIWGAYLKKLAESHVMPQAEPEVKPQPDLAAMVPIAGPLKTPITNAICITVLRAMLIALVIFSILVLLRIYN